MEFETLKTVYGAPPAGREAGATLAEINHRLPIPPVTQWVNFVAVVVPVDLWATTERSPPTAFPG
jgi:hypothetical protein